VPLLEQEFRRAIEHGFMDTELAEAKANILNAYQEAVKRKESRRSETLATAIASSINDATVFSTPETDLELATAALEKISVESVHSAFKQFWKAAGYHLVLSTKSEPEGALGELASRYEDSKSVEVAPPAEREAIPFAYTDFGKAGKVATTVKIEDLDATQITLSNNIRVNLKQTDFEKNRIRIFARIGSGQLSQPKDKPLLDAFASAVYDGGGLGKHSNDELS
jgi:zinc protease